MPQPDQTPRKDLFTNGDAEAWAEQFHMLFYVLRMSPQQIAEIDYGFDPENPDRWMVFSWRREIEREFPFFDVLQSCKTIAGRA